MSTELEDRIRRHYAERTLNEPVLDEAEAWRAPTRRHRAWRPVLTVAAAAVIAAVAVVVTTDRDERTPVVTNQPTVTTRPSTTTTPTTVATTTTTAVPQPDPNATFPVVVASTNGIIAWYDGANWTQSMPGMPGPVEGGEVWRIVSLDEPAVDVEGGPPAGRCPDGSALADIPGFTHGIAVTGTHNPQPRPVRIRTNFADYEDEKRDAMAHGVTALDGDPEIVQVVEADVDGDGTIEVFITVEQIEDPTRQVAHSTDYIAVFAMHEGSSPSMIGSWYADLNDPGPQPIKSVRLAAIADLNGAGTMQAVVDYSGAGSAATYVYGIWATATVMLFDAQCGS